MAQVIGQEMEMEVAGSEVVGAETQVTDTADEAKSTATKRDPLAKYKELSADNQTLVDEIVADVIGKIGGADNIDLALLLGVLDKLNAEKKTAREADKAKAKERKEEAKQKAIIQKEYAANVVKVDDTIDYYFSSKKVRVLGVKVEKVTTSSARIDITKDTLVEYKGKEMKAGELPASAGFTLGMKSAPLGKIENLRRKGEVISLVAEETEETEETEEAKA